MTTASFNPQRLSLARRRRGLTKLKLANAVGVDARSVSAWEKGEFVPEPEREAALSRILRFPVQFFYGDDLEEPLPDVASFRAMSKMTAAQRDTALGSGAIALMLNEWLEARFELPSPDVPDLSREASPEGAAVALRSDWCLGELPIKNMVHLLEAKGVRVFSLAIDAMEVDAFSMWRGSTPFVFLNTRKSAEHSRFDAAHELGHLVLHRHGSPQGREAEHQANQFASAFLMPRPSMCADAPRMATIPNLIKLKKVWGVSLAALIYRLHTVGVLTDWHYQSLFIDISQQGYRKLEPEPGQREISRLMQKVFASLRDDRIGRIDVARDLAISGEEIDELVFGLALTGVLGTGNDSRSASAPKPRPHLRLVGSTKQ
jgi:Zn-dependent peptidase ImmA (M78 family)/transcriptional regulator with XRE-family HTH domain